MGCFSKTAHFLQLCLFTISNGLTPPNGFMGSICGRPSLEVPPTTAPCPSGVSQGMAAFSSFSERPCFTSDFLNMKLSEMVRFICNTVTIPAAFLTVSCERSNRSQDSSGCSNGRSNVTISIRRIKSLCPRQFPTDTCAQHTCAPAPGSALHPSL